MYNLIVKNLLGNQILRDKEVWVRYFMFLHYSIESLEIKLPDF